MMLKLKEDILKLYNLKLLSKIIYSDAKQAIRLRFPLTSTFESVPDKWQTIRIKTLKVLRPKIARQSEPGSPLWGARGNGWSQILPYHGFETSPPRQKFSQGQAVWSVIPSKSTAYPSLLQKAGFLLTNELNCQGCIDLRQCERGSRSIYHAVFPGLGVHVESSRSSDSLSYRSHPAFSFPKYALQPVSGNKVKRIHELRTKGLEE